MTEKEVRTFQLISQTVGRKGVLNLLNGNFEKGWKAYDGRIGVHWFDRRHKGIPYWKGQIEPGKRLLLMYEQGIGEQVFFASVIPELVVTGLKIILEVDERLVTLMQRSFPEVEVIPYQFPFHEACYTADYQIPIGSAMQYFRKSFDDFKNNSKTSYLKPDPEIVAQLRGYEGRIGLSWFSNAVRFSKFKNIPFEYFKPLINQKAVISVQYSQHSESIPCIPDFDITQNLENFAALISICSKVITISNVAAHFAGALGVECQVLVPSDGNRHIYWYPERETVPNYPKVSAYKQHPVGDWKPLIDYIIKNNT